jgi:hypothetical protein
MARDRQKWQDPVNGVVDHPVSKNARKSCKRISTPEEFGYKELVIYTDNGTDDFVQFRTENQRQLSILCSSRISDIQRPLLQHIQRAKVDVKRTKTQPSKHNKKNQGQNRNVKYIEPKGIKNTKPQPFLHL